MGLTEDQIVMEILSILESEGELAQSQGKVTKIVNFLVSVTGEHSLRSIQCHILTCMREKTSIIHKIHNLGSIPASGIQAPEPLKDRGHIFRQIAFPFHFFPCDGMSKLQAGSMKHLSSDLDNCTPDPEFRRPAV